MLLSLLTSQHPSYAFRCVIDLLCNTAECHYELQTWLLNSAEAHSHQCQQCWRVPGRPLPQFNFTPGNTFLWPKYGCSGGNDNKLDTNVNISVALRIPWHCSWKAKGSVTIGYISRHSWWSLEESQPTELKVPLEWTIPELHFLIYKCLCLAVNKSIFIMQVWQTKSTFGITSKIQPGF